MKYLAVKPSNAGTADNTKLPYLKKKKKKKNWTSDKKLWCITTVYCIYLSMHKYFILGNKSLENKSNRYAIKNAIKNHSIGCSNVYNFIIASRDV